MQALPARLQVPAPPAAVEPRQPGRRWPDARSAAPLSGRRVRTCEGQPTLTELTGLTRENEKEEKKPQRISTEEPHRNKPLHFGQLADQRDVSFLQ